MDLLPTKSRIILALEALKKDPKLNFQRVITIYNVLLITFSNRRVSWLARYDIPANSYKFTDLEEKTIV